MLVLSWVIVGPMKFWAHQMTNVSQLICPVVQGLLMEKHFGFDIDFFVLFIRHGYNILLVSYVVMGMG